MTAILLNSFPKPVGFGTAYNNEKQSWNTIPTGFFGFAFGKNEYEAAFENGLRQLFLSFIMHDRVLLRYDDFVRCIDVLGAENIASLMQEDILSVIYDCHDFAFLERNGELKLEILTKILPLRDLDEGYTNIKCKNSNVQSQLRELVDSKKILVNGDNSPDKNPEAKELIDEIERDFSSKKLRDSLGLREDTPSLVEKSMQLRVCEVAQGFILQRKSDSESVIQDAISEAYLRHKVIGNSNSEIKTDGFEYLLREKGVPDLYDLFKRKILSIEDIIKIRESGQAAIFRKWLESNEFDKEKMVSSLLRKKKKSLSSTVVRFLYPTIIGLFNAPLGVAASAIDSFFLGKLLTNWTPEVYLDKKIGSYIEKKQKIYTESRLLELRKRHGLRGPFEDCYCGSGKAFSKCHGQIW